MWKREVVVHRAERWGADGEGAGEEG